jgi:hypothetical protein
MGLIMDVMLTKGTRNGVSLSNPLMVSLSNRSW